MLVAIFVVTGWDKLANTQDMVADIAEAGLPAPFLLSVAAGVVELVCGGGLWPWAGERPVAVLAVRDVAVREPVSSARQLRRPDRLPQESRDQGRLADGRAVGAQSGCELTPPESRSTGWRSRPLRG